MVTKAKLRRMSRRQLTDSRSASPCQRSVVCCSRCLTCVNGTGYTGETQCLTLAYHNHKLLTRPNPNISPDLPYPTPPCPPTLPYPTYATLLPYHPTLPLPTQPYPTCLPYPSSYPTPTLHTLPYPTLNLPYPTLPHPMHPTLRDPTLHPKVFSLALNPN